MYRVTRKKRTVIQAWKSGIDNEEEIQRASKHYQRRQLWKFMKKWKSFHFLSIEAKMNSLKCYCDNKENEEALHNAKVAELFHFLQSHKHPNVVRNTKQKKSTSNSYSDNKEYKQGRRLKEKKTNKRSVLRSQSKSTALQKIHVQSKTDTDKEAAASKVCEDEEERKSYLRQKRKEKIAKKQKEEALALTKRASRLSKLHYSLVLIRKIYSKWKRYTADKRLFMVKATKFSDLAYKNKYFMGLRDYVREKRAHEERSRLRNAGKNKNQQCLIMRLGPQLIHYFHFDSL